jgi:voltage-gated potassium channel
MFSAARQQVYQKLNPQIGHSKWDTAIDRFFAALIVLNVVAVILETVQELYAGHTALFKNFELFSVCVFTIEYLLRLWACTCDAQYRHPLFGRLRYAVSAGALVDLLAILPFFGPGPKSIDLRFIRVLRLARFMRIFKLGRYFNAARVISKVLKDKTSELCMCLVVMGLLIVIASSGMYFVENGAQPDKFASIPETMWWCVITLTTVGYGDVFPVTIMGKLLTAILAVLGIGFFALPAGILSSAFAEEFQNQKCAEKRCPHCGGGL